MNSLDKPKPKVSVLALSGGGFRAALFHLGVVDYLRSANLLSGLEHIVAVSGGSVLAAHLVLNWERYTTTTEAYWEARSELIRFVRLDVRGRLIRRFLVYGPFVRIARPFLFWRSRWQPILTQSLARYYDTQLYKGATLHEMPSKPRIHVLSTNLNKGSLTAFSQDEIRHYPADQNSSSVGVPAGLATVAYAVTASSAYPAMFPPLSLDHSDVGAEEPLFPLQFFTDAGVMDNLGIQALSLNSGEEGGLILLSDAGQSYLAPEEAGFGILRTALRAADLMMYRIRGLAMRRVQEMEHSSRIVAVCISDCEALPGAAPVVVQQPLQSIRTDLDAFSRMEIEELTRHGYFRAERELGFAGSARPEFAGSSRVASATAKRLQAGSRRKWRVVNLWDWFSLVQLALLLAISGAFIFLSPWAAKQVKSAESFLVAARNWDLISMKAPSWARFSVPEAIPVEEHTPMDLSSFRVHQEDRTWDLRQLRWDKASGKVVGQSLMMRSTTLVRSNVNAVEYGFTSETSGSRFEAWCEENAFPLKIFRRKEMVFNGTRRVLPFQVRVDVSGKPVGEPFVLTVHTLTQDAFLSRQNWWIGMNVGNSNVNEISMRVLFPETLRYRNPDFTSYPYRTPQAAKSDEGVTLHHRQHPELLWRIKNPKPDYVYRVQWDW